LPSHQDYQLEQNLEITTAIEDDIKKIKHRLDDVALWIDLDVYYCTHDPCGVIHAGDTAFHADNTDKKQCSESTKRVKFSDKVVRLAIRNTEQDCGGDNICPPSNASAFASNDLGKVDVWIHQDPDLDIVNISSSSDGSSFSDQMDELIDDEDQNWPIFESFTQNEVDSSFAFDASPFPPVDSPRIASKRVVVKIPPPIKEATTTLKRNQGRRKLKSVKQTMESSAQDHKEQNTPQHKSRHTFLENKFSFDGSQNGFEIDSNHFDAFKHELDEFYFDPTHPTTDSRNLQVLNIVTNEASDKNHGLSTNLRMNKFQKEASSSLFVDMTFAKNTKKHLDKVGDLQMIFSEGNNFGWNDLVVNDVNTPEPNRMRHMNRLTRDHSRVEDEHISSSFSEWDDSFVSDSNNLSSDNFCHSSNSKVMSFGSSDDSAHDADNSLVSKIEMISDDFSQSIDSSRFSKSTSSTAETDTMTTDDDIESSWCRVSKKLDCDVGYELDYLESKVKDLKIKQDSFASAGTLPTDNIQDNTEATVRDLITGEGKIVRLKSLLTPTKITAQLSYENDRVSPHDEIDELDLVSSSDAYSKTHIQIDNENQPSTVTKNTARISRNMTASRLRALKATSAWKRRYGNDN